MDEDCSAERRMHFNFQCDSQVISVRKKTLKTTQQRKSEGEMRSFIPY